MTTGLSNAAPGLVCTPVPRTPAVLKSFGGGGVLYKVFNFFGGTGGTGGTSKAGRGFWPYPSPRSRGTGGTNFKEKTVNE